MLLPYHPSTSFRANLTLPNVPNANKLTHPFPLGHRYELCHDAFKQFLDPSNLTAQLLLAYFVALQMLMVPLAVYEWPDRADSAKSRVLTGTVEWATGIFERLEDAGSPLVDCLAWPRRIMGIVRREIGEEAADLDHGGESRHDEDGLAQLGVSVLKLGLPISPSVEGEGDGGDEEAVHMGWEGDGGLPRFWEHDVDPVGALVDPVLVTTMGMDGVLTSTAPLPSIHGPTDFDMEML